MRWSADGSVRDRREASGIVYRLVLVLVRVVVVAGRYRAGQGYDQKSSRFHEMQPVKQACDVLGKGSVHRGTVRGFNGDERRSSGAVLRFFRSRWD